MKFEFLVKTVDGDVWTQLQGSGGQIGNGCLHIDVPALPDDERAKLLRALLVRARHDFKEDGVVYFWKGDEPDPSKRIVAVEAEDILEVRYVGVAG